MKDCMACQLTSGQQPVPGGRIWETDNWVVEHCIGSLGVGTLVVKPFRHCVHIWQLTKAESEELGPVLAKVSQVVQQIVKPDQIYVCLWSHANWKPGHIHFVVQPVWNSMVEFSDLPGPALQSMLFQRDDTLDLGAVEKIASKMRKRFSTDEQTTLL